jgi:hypothetical protein
VSRGIGSARITGRAEAFESTRTKAYSGAAGVGGGLSLVTIAHTLPSGWDSARSVLEYASPLFSVGSGFLWAMGISWYKQRQAASARRQVMSELTQAELLRDQVYRNRSSSVRSRKVVQENLERVQLLASTLTVKTAEALVRRLPPEPFYAVAQTEELSFEDPGEADDLQPST